MLFTQTLKRDWRQAVIQADILLPKDALFPLIAPEASTLLPKLLFSERKRTDWKRAFFFYEEEVHNGQL